MDKPKAVEILDFNARVELGVAFGANRHVRIAAEAALLHVRIANLEESYNRMQLFEIGNRFIAAAHVGLADNLE